MTQGLLAIRAGTLIDGNGGEPLHDAVILVKDGRIQQVGPAAHVTIPPEAEVVDATGKTVLPGLVDAHLHIHSDGSPSPADALMQSQGMMALRSYAHARKLLSMGITALRTLNSPGYVDVALRNAINEGVVEGPRMRASGWGLSITGGHMDHGTWAPEVQIAGRSGVCDGPWACRAATRTQIKYGADVIKINACVGDSYDLDNPSRQEMTYEEMAAICEQAHWHNLRVAAHTSGGSGITDAIRAGVDSLEHAHWLTDEQIEMMVEHGTFYVPTLIVNERCTEASRRQRDGRGRDWLEKVYIEKWESLARAKKAGVKIAVGTDSGFEVCHGENAIELEQLVKGGFTPMEAIVAGTRTSADCIDMLSDIGTIEAGKFADLIVLQGDPLQDIRILQDANRIEQVFKGGKAVK